MYRPDALSVDEEKVFNKCPLEMYPNPVGNTLYLDDVNRKNLQDCQITLTNLLGQVLFEADVKNTYSINMENYTQGVYLVCIKCNGRTWSKKVVKL